MNNEGHPIPILTQLNLETDIIYVAVPNNFRSIKKKNIILAREWRKLTRKLFIELFAAGWEVVDFYSYRSSDLPLHFYVLKNNFKKGSFQNEN